MPSDVAPRLEVTRGGGFTVARVVGCESLSETHAEEFRRQAVALVGGTHQYLILDLAGVTFLGSTALTKLLALDKKVRAAGGRMTLVNLRPTVREVFAVTRLDKVIDVRPADPRGLSA